MKGFRFPLHKLQRLRAHWERAARRDLATELAQLQVLEDKRRLVDENLAACEDEGQGSASNLEALAQALQAGLRSSRQQLAAKAEAARERVDHARQSYYARRKDLRSLENLRQRRWQSWLTEVEAEAQAELDETSRLRFQNLRHEQEREASQR